MGNAGHSGTAGPGSGAARFSPEEVRALKTAFKDLALRSPGKTVDKATFLLFFPLPGLHGERLFSVFDYKNQGVLDLEEFIVGLGTVCRGSFEEKANLIYRIYDIKGDGVRKKDLKMMLLHMPQHAFFLPRVQQLADHAGADAGAESDAVPPPLLHVVGEEEEEGEEEDDDDQEEGDKEAPRLTATSEGAAGTTSVAVNVPLDEELDASPQSLLDANEAPLQSPMASADDEDEDQYSEAKLHEALVDMLVEQAFAECDLTLAGNLSNEQFRLWVERTPEVVAFFESVFPSFDAANTSTSINGDADRRTDIPATAADEPAGAADGTAQPASGPRLNVSYPYVGPSGPYSNRATPCLTPAGSPAVGTPSMSIAHRASRVDLSTFFATVSSGNSTPGVPPATPGVVTYASVVAGKSVPHKTASLSSVASAVTATSLGGASQSQAQDAGAGAATRRPQPSSSPLMVASAASTDIEVEGAFVSPLLPSAAPPSLAAVGAGSNNNNNNNNREILITDDGPQFELDAPAGAAGEDDDAYDTEGEAVIPLSPSRMTGGQMVGVSRVYKGTLFKVGRRFHKILGRWYVLFADDNLLYYYHNRHDTKPAGVIFLEGCFVNPTEASPEDGPPVVQDKKTSPSSAFIKFHESAGAQEGELPVESVREGEVGDPQPQTKPRPVPSPSSSQPVGGGSFRDTLHSLLQLVCGGLCSRSAGATARGEAAILEDSTHHGGGAAVAGDKPATAEMSSATDAVRHPKGLFGIEIVTGDKDRRVVYSRSKRARDEWLAAMRVASRVVPFDAVYEILEEIGSGRFCKVHKCRHRESNKLFAVKVIDKSTLSTADKELMRTEVAVLKLVREPHIVQLESVFKSRNHLYIVMELSEDGDLFSLLAGGRRLSEVEAYQVMRPLLRAVDYLHSRGIVHRDVKPENILCGKRLGDVKIADFGLSFLMASAELEMLPCGTLSYVSPEVITGKGYDHEADLWSLGVVLFLMVTGELPYDSGHKRGIVEKILHRDIPTTNEVFQTLSPEFMQLLRGLLTKDPSQRLTASDALKLPWFSLMKQRVKELRQAKQQQQQQQQQEAPPREEGKVADDASALVVT